MAEFVYWKIGKDTQILINEQAYLDYRARLEQLDMIVADYIALVKRVEPQSNLSVDGYIGLNQFDGSGELSEIFLNANNIEMAVTFGSGDNAVTNVLMNFSDKLYHTLESAEQISRSGMYFDFDVPEMEETLEIHKRAPYVYECPISNVEVKLAGDKHLSDIFADQVAVIESNYNWENQRVIVLPDFVLSREQMDGQSAQTGEANFSTQKMPYDQISYIYPAIT